MTDSSSSPPDATVTPSRPYYSPERTLSPTTRSTARALREISERASDLSQDRFSKVGASATVSQSFLHCFDRVSSADELSGIEETWPTLESFRSTGESSFSRESLSTTVGWTAARALRGEPSPLSQEIEAHLPGFAVVMYGTNDVGYRNLNWYAENLWNLVETLADRGVIPILNTIMPRDDDAGSWAPLVREHNAVVRALAETYELPLIDYHREMQRLPDHGLSRDLIHPSTFRRDGRYAACAFSEEALTYGYNLRNWLTLQMLHATTESLSGSLSDSEALPAVVGNGSAEDPFMVERFPFRDRQNTVFSEHRNLNQYTGCDATQDESGPEYVYQINLDRPKDLRILLFDRGEVDIDLHWLGAEVSESACVQRAHESLSLRAPAGRSHLVLDSFVSSSGAERAGEYILVILADDTSSG